MSAVREAALLDDSLQRGVVATHLLVLLARERIKPGMRVELVAFAVDPGYLSLPGGAVDSGHLFRRGDGGTVNSVDDDGNIHVSWDRGVDFGLTWSDDFKIFEPDEPLKVDGLGKVVF